MARDDRRGAWKLLLGGAAVIVIVQFAFQVAVLFANSAYKGGLINARILIWQGIQAAPVARALLLQLAVFLLLTIVLSGMALLSACFLKRRMGLTESLWKVMLLVLLALYSALLVVNVYLYPGTLARLEVVSDWQARGFALPLYLGFATVLGACALCLLEVLRLVTGWWRVHRPLSKLGLGSAIVLFALIGLAWGMQSVDTPVRKVGGSASIARPNIILIGLDSVRVDVIENNELRPALMPNLDHFLLGGQTAWYTNAYTPIARTFAAWYALLSGREPVASGVRYNLQAIGENQKGDTLVTRLREAGYYTVYGSDEKRFSAIDQSYGFEETIGPPAGAAEWLLSILEDTPLHNVIRDTAIGRRLFPYTYGNRGSFSTYRPAQFVELVADALPGLQQQQPLFLSLHLCLSHWPYVWSDKRLEQTQPEAEDYFRSLAVMDDQFGDVLAILQRAELLENSLVIVFTDHGEGMVQAQVAKKLVTGPGAGLQLPGASDLSWGHGTDLLTPTQNQILVSVLDRTGLAGLSPGTNDRLTSLLDISPTIARVAGLDRFVSDGEDLAHNPRGNPNHRVIFMETGFDPVNLAQGGVNIEEMVLQGATAYEVAPTGNLQIKQEFHDLIIDNKSRGVTDGSYLLSWDVQTSPEGRSRRFRAIEIGNPGRVITAEEFIDAPGLLALSERLRAYYADEDEPR